MTFLAPAPTPRTRRSVTWNVADKNFWVANNAGAFAGTIDRHGAHFYVRDCFGRYLGDYPTLLTAQHRLEQHLRIDA